ncbi:cytidine deaminase [Tenacibaculum sp. SG-28]|uniref:cytidine deaminase n=1 Tax=Tenacibaculum sp. SG-28 TaxID=754426 RepID=UPI000CF54426|nr:cytidine deaminase [Tenacibaculum sp. SG-28]PQJ21080.1 cytidine deaminase [Tenacibaculum sp. SG-28]
MSELSAEDIQLMKQAIAARDLAYAPYSKFSVGAALLLDNGTIITGNNQENAAYPSGMCAERVAIWKAGSEHPNMVVKKIAITASSSTSTVDKPVGPCGACRQTLSEYEINQKEPITLIFMGEVGKIVKIKSLLSLLPFSFDSSYL